MRVAILLASRHCLSIGLLTIALGCVTPSNVRVEEFGDVSSYHTWDWLVWKDDQAHTQIGEDVSLEWSIAQEVRSALGQLGLRHDRRRPEVLVYFNVDVRRQRVEYTQTGAMQLLSSLHDSPSYWVQASEVEHRYYEIVELRIVLVDPKQSRVIWRGVLDGRYRGEFAPHVREAVSELVARLPAPRSDGPRQIVLKAEPREVDAPPQS